MPNIVLTRIDNRLIHGQVATMWSGVLGVNLLLVANDNVAKDELRQSLMNMLLLVMLKQDISLLKKLARSLTRPALLRKFSLSVKIHRMY